MRQLTSRPARSPIWNGPIGKPNAVSAPSTSCGNAPSNKSFCASMPRAESMRLPTKPWHTPTTTGTLPSLRATATAVASVSGAVFSPRTISRSFITFAGEKKCMPTTDCGRAVAAAMSFTLR